MYGVEQAEPVDSSAKSEYVLNKNVWNHSILSFIVSGSPGSAFIMLSAKVCWKRFSRSNMHQLAYCGACNFSPSADNTTLQAGELQVCGGQVGIIGFHKPDYSSIFNQAYKILHCTKLYVLVQVIHSHVICIPSSTNTSDLMYVLQNMFYT